MTFYSFYFNSTSVPGYKSYNSAPSFFTFDRKGPYYQNNRSVRDLIEDEGDAP